MDSLSELFSTEDTELSDTSVSQNTRSKLLSILSLMADVCLRPLWILMFDAGKVPDDHGMPYESKRGAASIRSPCFVEQEPTPLQVQLQSSEEICTIPEASQSVTVIRNQGSQRTISTRTEADGSGEQTASPTLHTIWYFKLYSFVKHFSKRFYLVLSCFNVFVLYAFLSFTQNQHNRDVFISLRAMI